MTVANQTEDHQACCVPHLIKLRMLARAEVEVPHPGLDAAEVMRATGAILAAIIRPPSECAIGLGLRRHILPDQQGYDSVTSRRPDPGGRSSCLIRS